MIDRIIVGVTLRSLLLLWPSAATLTDKCPARELAFMSIVPNSHIHSLCKSLQAVACNPYFSCWTQRQTFPHYLSRRMVSHTLLSQKGSYCSGLMHSQTQWFCRLESHFLLGEVSHCNKAGRDSQGRISTPGWDKWSVVFVTLFLSKVSPILFFFFAFSYNSKLICSEFSPEDVLFLRFSHRIATNYHQLIRLNAVQKVYWSAGFAVVLSAMHWLHGAAF